VAGLSNCISHELAPVPATAAASSAPLGPEIWQQTRMVWHQWVLHGLVGTVAEALGIEASPSGSRRRCVFQPGDGTHDGSGSEEKVGTTWTRDECSALVQSKRPEANGATWPANGHAAGATQQTNTVCYAEFGMTGADGSAAWQTCMFETDAVRVRRGI
jgi:hypothetical protein